jgi:hypothetical protein
MGTLGVFLAFMVAPPGDTRNVRSSPDFAGGPITANSSFPITATGADYGDGQAFDATLASFTVPAINRLPVDTPIDGDGFSHFPIFGADNADFGRPDWLRRA